MNWTDFSETPRVLPTQDIFLKTGDGQYALFQGEAFYFVTSIKTVEKINK